ncbi:class I SAM-dependent methyltransferase [Winogradskyella ouciana]|uniref:Methyltransferase domain-containing protein n=1 Tax=Winogradskyella ouciana TaxID=2608631 RepID=A0A7K1GA24_9FLAO|nr:class I SAM-dependent methyltransferase [Winogradskyella ouciana]MTE25993.1 methyltransferase domain-containing protein [Winogradskyella ouciana]
MNKAKISTLLRQFKLIYLTDLIRFRIQKYKHSKANAAFKKKHPNVKLPPDYLMYESFQMNYDKYYNGGLQMAKSLTDHFKNHIELENKRILDWGCGPGRIIRHMPKVINKGCEFFGTDYNEKSIAWCSKNLPGIHFNKNELTASLPYEDDSMDVIYGISIFTHLSEQMHYDWFNELYRVLKPNGIMLLTMQGDNFKIKLNDSELKLYDQGNIVVRGNVKEGHRTYSAFHPKAFVQSLFSKTEVLEHIVQSSEHKSWVPQDIWIVRK